MQKEKLILPSILVLGAALRLINLLNFQALESDEAIYAQTIFTLTKGLIPFKDVFIASPPVYFYLSYPVILVDPSLYLIRIFNVALSLGTLYMIFKICELAYSRRVAIVSSLIFAIFPLAIYTNRIVIIENGLNLFVSISVFFLTKYLIKNNQTFILLSGFFVGIFCMTKYTGIPVTIAILIFILIYVRRLKPLFLFVAGLVIVPLGIFTWLTISNIWQIFYTQTIYWQMIRASQSLSDKIFFISVSFVVGVIVLIIFSVPMLFIGRGNKNDKLAILIFFIPLISILSSKQIFPQYFIILIIPLCILTARTIDHYQLYTHTRAYIRNSWKKVATFAIMAIIIESLLYGYVLSAYDVSSQSTNIFFNNQEKALLDTQMAAGNYIKKFTKPSDKIWTTDAALAFFSQRVIVTANSTYWKYQGFFIDIWAYGPNTGSYQGPIKDYPNGTITLNDIKLALESEKPKIIVIENTSQTDSLIWNGINNPYSTQKGLSTFIENYYHPAIDEEGLYLASQGIYIWMTDNATT